MIPILPQKRSELNPGRFTKYAELSDAYRVFDRAVERAYGWNLDGLSWDEKGPYRFVVV